MKLSEQAIKDLRNALRNHVDEKSLQDLTDDELSQIGELFLCLTADCLKIQMKSKYQFLKAGGYGGANS